MGSPLTFLKKIFCWIPVLFISAIIVWSYYAYVVELCFMTVKSVPEKVLYLLLYHIIAALFVWTYWKAIFQEHASVPPQYKLTHEEREAFLRATNDVERKAALHDRAARLPIYTFTQGGAYRYCDKCQCLKPDRAHHCSMCEKCILKMDHHCPWVNNCVGFRTYKFFLLFLAYAEVYCVYIALTTLKYFIEFWENGGMLSANRGKLQILFLFFVAFMFGVSLTALLGYHIFLTLKNRSTLESFRAPVMRSGTNKNAFNLGRNQNFREVFGDSPHRWFLPVFSSRGDGVEYVLSFGCQHNASTYSAVTFARNNGFPSEDTITEEDVKPIMSSEMPPGVSDPADELR